LRLGADVPFFVGGRNAFVEGIGEKLTPIDVPASTFAVVKPPVSIPTRSIFESPLLARNTKPVIVTGFPAGTCQLNGRNDLQPPAEAQAPEVAVAAKWLESRFGNSRMTGSGSAVFAWVGTDEGPAATRQVEELPPGWVGRLCRSLPEHPLVGWAD
jgi:4-diphosphocytidyl-2-C-methyl-D-erythritol kinase